MNTTLTPSAATSPSKNGSSSQSVPDTTVGSPKPTKRIVSAGQRRSEIMIATLFVLTGVVAIFAALVLDPVLHASDYLTRVYPHRGAVELSALLWSINNIGIVFIAVQDAGSDRAHPRRGVNDTAHRHESSRISR